MKRRMDMSNQTWGNEYRTTIVCVDSYHNGVPVGRFYHPYYPNGESFYGLARLLTRMTETLDAMDFPQSFTAARTFMSAPAQRRQPTEETTREGQLATFAVRILMRQNATWQGAVTWLEGGRSQNFRSALELVLLMDSALRGAVN